MLVEKIRLVDYSGNCQRDKQMGPRANEASHVSRGKNGKTEAVLLQVLHEKAAFFGKDDIAEKIEGSRKKERPNTRWADSTEEAVGGSLQS